MMEDRAKGTVKWFNKDTGYGFISCGDVSDDIFVHFRNIRGEGFRTLREGQEVEFSIQKGERGLNAEDVIPA